MCALFFYIWQAPHMPILTAYIICTHLWGLVIGGWLGN